MLFSRSAEYAVRAMTFLAMQPSGKLSGAREIAAAERIPIPFLWKILQNLARRRLIRSFKGLRGGYELAMPAETITLQAVVGATDGDDLTGGCVLGMDTCGEENACPLHDTWKRIRGEMNAMMEQNTLADLAQVARRRSKKKRA
jgi:Rrf2 family protein